MRITTLATILIFGVALFADGMIFDGRNSGLVWNNTKYHASKVINGVRDTFSGTIIG